MLKEFSEDFSSIKKIQSEMKDMLIKIKNNLQGIKSRVDKAENQISDLEHKEAKNNQLHQQEEKRIQKTRNSISSFWETSSIPTFTSYGRKKEKRKSKELEIYLKK